MSRPKTLRLGRARSAAFLMIAALGIVASACASSAAPTIPTLRSPNASPSASVTPEQAMRAYVSCMRGKGIAMPDPKVQSNGEVELIYPEDIDKGAFGAADEGCRSLLANAYPATTENPNGAQEQDQLLAYARCMREHGIDMADPAGGPGSVTVNAGTEPGAVDPSFAAADQACAHFLPGKPGSSPSPSGSGR